ncbi:hypothetical protein P8452_13788 [Trifolium repens]|nr:hypothetical protein P8452_13788 [Trifolium repens]
MDQVNTTPEGTSNPTQESSCQPTQVNTTPERIKLRESQPTTPSSSGATIVANDDAEFDASWLWAAENGTSRVAEDFATVLNEMESDDEAELVESPSGYHFED